MAANLAVVRDRIAGAGGDPSAVTVVAVTKGFGPEAVVAAREAGLDQVGENYAPELLDKAAAVAGVDWHFLGRIQRNKVARLAPVVSLWQGVARAEEGAAIARHRPGAAVLVQVDLTGAPGRNGRPPAEVPGLVDRLRADGLAVEGLMTVAPPGPGARAAFAAVAALADELGLAVRSMGMTEDLEAAVGEGATMVRVGRALFGPRFAAGTR